MDTDDINNEVDKILDLAGKRKGALITLLQKIQECFGYLPRPAIERLAVRLGVPVSEIIGVYSFYAQFRTKPVGKQHIKVCHGTACHVSGADKVSYALKEELGIGHGETSKDGVFSVEEVACLGCCSLAPVMMIDEETFGRLTPDRARKILREV